MSETMEFQPREPALHAARVEYLCSAYAVPESTLRALEAKGDGPRVFLIGRLRFCRLRDWHEWLDRLAETGGAAVTRRRPKGGAQQPAA